MKKVLCILLSILFVILAAAAIVPPLSSLNTTKSPSFGAYKHVFIVGVDGGGQFFRDMDMPNFKRIFADGAVKYNVRTEVLSDSGPNWASMLLGVSYFKHYIHNGNSGEVERTSDSNNPSVYRVIREARPQATLVSFGNWNNINYGIIENDINVNKIHIPDDKKLTDKICSYFDEGNKPELFFVQLDLVDGAGHAFGSASKEYADAMHTADIYIGQIYDALERNGLLEDGLFLVTTDHGHKRTGGHGRFSKRESLTTIAAAGKTVIPGGKLDFITRDRDMAAITLFALGLKRPINMSARLPGDLFEETNGEARSFFKDLLDGIISPVMWLVTLVTEG